MFVFKSKYDEVVSDLTDLEKYVDKVSAENTRLQAALKQILGNETTAPNATVTRILNIAKGALEIK